MTGVTTIPVDKETRDRLKTFGLKGETYDDIINRLMEQVEYEEFMERQYRRLEEKDKFIPLDEI
ncbi:MAG: hypothetical protein QMC85_00200 [Methanocellales archaeon]|nr:hypothetical protein [Methanocellales archaeon]MDI6903746.1 hypothetical protein [Methanocellales archaeon]